MHANRGANYKADATSDDGSCVFDTTIIQDYGFLITSMQEICPNYVLGTLGSAGNWTYPMTTAQANELIGGPCFPTFEPLDVPSVDTTTAYPQGCTDPQADNYDETAIIDDGSCDFGESIGCTIQGATNYKDTAIFDDGSCEFDNEQLYQLEGVNPETEYLFGCTDPDAVSTMKRQA